MVKNQLQRSILVLAVLLLGSMLASEAQAQQTVMGITGEGAEYQFWVPTNWNKDLVVWVHGIIDPALPVDLFPDATQGMGGCAMACWPAAMHLPIRRFPKMDTL